MKTVRFICRNCGHGFTIEVFEKGEAEEKRVHAYPIHCPECKSLDVERR